METLKYKGYTGSIEYYEEEEGNYYYGKVIGLPRSYVTYEGDTLEELKEDFEGAVDFYLANCKARNVEPEKPISSGVFIRMPIDLHSHIARVAKANGESMNAFINRAIRREAELCEA